MKHRLTGIVVALIMIVAAGATLGYRKVYGTWWQTPQHIAYCERTYLSATPALSHAEIIKRESKTALPGDAPYPVVTVGKVPPIVGQPLLAAVTPEAARHRLGLPCTMGIYLKTGADVYTAYGLSGGP
jgi:hypothetical protein